MKDESVSISEVIAFIMRHFWVASVCLCIGGAVGVGLTYILPKTFKSTSSIAIQSSYFRNPLVNDLISEEHDQSELRAQREALLRLALSDPFLDSLAEQHSLYDSSLSAEEVLLQRTLLRERIEYYPLNPTTYTLSVLSSTREQAQSMNRAVLEQMVETLERQRNQTLVTTRDAIRTHVKSAAETLKELEAAASSRGADDIQDELARVSADLETLELHFTDKHPKVFALRRQQQSLQNLLKALERAGKEQNDDSGATSSIPLSGAAKEPMQDVYNDLMKKLNYLNILLEIEYTAGESTHVAIIDQPSYPLAALSPKRSIFGLAGLFLGFLVALALILLREFRAGAFWEPEKASEQLDLPYFGELPELPGGDELLLLEGEVVRRFEGNYPARFASDL